MIFRRPRKPRTFDEAKVEVIRRLEGKWIQLGDEKWSIISNGHYSTGMSTYSLDAYPLTMLYTFLEQSQSSPPGGLDRVWR